MLVDVRERLGNDVVGGRLDRLGKRAIGHRDEVDRHGRAQRERVERGDEAALGEHGRVKAARELPQLLQPGRELVDRRVEEVEILGVTA